MVLGRHSLAHDRQPNRADLDERADEGVADCAVSPHRAARARVELATQNRRARAGLRRAVEAGQRDARADRGRARAHRPAAARRRARRGRGAAEDAWELTPCRARACPRGSSEQADVSGDRACGRLGPGRGEGPAGGRRPRWNSTARRPWRTSCARGAGRWSRRGRRRINGAPLNLA